MAIDGDAMGAIVVCRVYICCTRAIVGLWSAQYMDGVMDRMLQGGIYGVQMVYIAYIRFVYVSIGQG